MNPINIPQSCHIYQHHGSVMGIRISLESPISGRMSENLVYRQGLLCCVPGGEIPTDKLRNFNFYAVMNEY